MKEYVDELIGSEGGFEKPQDNLNMEDLFNESNTSEMENENFV